MNTDSPLRTEKTSHPRSKKLRGVRSSGPRLAVARSHASAVGRLIASLTTQGSAFSELGSADACLLTFVDCRLLLAAQLLDEEGHDSAAACLSETHHTLLSILKHAPRPSSCYQSALWHSRRTHCALLRHVQEFGSHIAIEDAFRAGYLTLTSTQKTVYQEMA